jgi:uncharacterized membrane protein YhhN
VSDPLLYQVVCALAVAGLLVAEWRGSRPGVWVAKPLASTAFIAAAFAWGALDSTYGRLVLLALALCWLGDVLLIPRERPAVFIAGITSFLLGHVAFAGAFAQRSLDATAFGASAVPMAVFAGVVIRWLWPRLSGVFRAAVPLYVVVISLMVATGFGTVAGAGRPEIALGALMFTASDLAVARDRFVSPGFANPAWGLPLYFAAQLVLASTVR